MPNSRESSWKLWAGECRDSVVLPKPKAGFAFQRVRATDEWAFSRGTFGTADPDYEVGFDDCGIARFKAEYANLALDWVAYVAGKRESRRLIGDHVLCEQDVVNRIAYPDGTACSTWSVDLHYPDPKNSANFPGMEFKSIAKHQLIHPYPIPYRCLYSKNVSNLFMAGRNISVTHVALGTVRVMRTTGMMGEVVGMAAAVCIRNRCLPREVYTSHWSEMKELMIAGVGTGKPQPPQNYNLGGTLMKKDL